jgi:hypothetical protein
LAQGRLNGMPTPRSARPAGGRQAPPGRRRLFAALGLASLLGVAACQTSVSPSPAPPTSAATGAAQLVTEAAVSATIGPAGGDLSAADPAHGRTYHLVVPAGAFEADTAVTMTPIAAIDGFAYGDLLGGVELEPTGVAFHDSPASLEIGLDADHAAALAAALDTDQIITGFRYEETPADLGPDLARASSDGATVTIPLVTFSGHGAGTRPASPEMARVLAELRSPQRDDDALLRLLRDWELAIEDALREAARYINPGEWLQAYQEASLWHFIASNLGYLSGDKWYSAGDGLQPEASQLQTVIDDVWEALVRDVNDECATDGAADLAELASIWQSVLLDGWALPAFEAILSPSTFCYDYSFAADPAPVALEEGQSQDIDLALLQVGNAPWASDAQLQAMGLTVTAVAVDPALVRLSGYRPAASQVRITATALQAVPGNADEGAFSLNVQVLGMEFYDVETISFDIIPGQTPPPQQAGPSRCDNAPLQLVNKDNQPPNNAVVIHSDGATCYLTDNSQLSASDAMMTIESGVNSPEFFVSYAQGWNGSIGDGSGAEDAHSTGSYETWVLQHSTGQWYRVDFTVEIDVAYGREGQGAATMTISDVSMTPVPESVVPA